MKHYYVYIMSNTARTLHTGVTNDLLRRVDEHRRGLTPGFASKYKLARLVFFEETSDVLDAIAREKQIKGWIRRRKIELIQSLNPDWNDLSADWFEVTGPGGGRH